MGTHSFPVPTHRLKLTYLYACWIIYMRHHLQLWKWHAKEMPLVLGRSGSQYVTMVTKLWSIFSRTLLQIMKHFWYKLAKISFFITFARNVWMSVWRHHLTNLHILKTWISLEQKEMFENSKQHFSSHTDCLLCFKMAAIDKMRLSS